MKCCCSNSQNKKSLFSAGFSATRRTFRTASCHTPCNVRHSCSRVRSRRSRCRSAVCSTAFAACRRMEHAILRSHHGELHWYVLRRIFTLTVVDLTPTDLGVMRMCFSLGTHVLVYVEPFLPVYLTVFGSVANLVDGLADTLLQVGGSPTACRIPTEPTPLP